MITPNMNKVEIQKQMWDVIRNSALVAACVHKFDKDCRKLPRGRIVLTRRFFHKDTNQAYILCFSQYKGAVGKLMLAEADYAVSRSGTT